MSNTTNGDQNQQGITFTRSDDAALLAALCLPDFGQERLHIEGTAEREAVLKTQVNKIKLQDVTHTLQAHRTDDADANLAPSAIVKAYQSLGRRAKVARVVPRIVEPEEAVVPRIVEPEETVQNEAAIEAVLEQRASQDEREEEAFNKRVRKFRLANTGTAKINLLQSQTVRKLKLRQNGDLRRHRYEQAIL